MAIFNDAAAWEGVSLPWRLKEMPVRVDADPGRARSVSMDAAAKVVFSAIKWGSILGGTGFALGFFGPMILAPGANQGPLLGIFITGPLGFLIGLPVGAVIALLPRLRQGGTSDAGSGSPSESVQQLRDEDRWAA